MIQIFIIASRSQLRLARERAFAHILIHSPGRPRNYQLSAVVYRSTIRAWARRGTWSR
jgi:hypothetical protein